VPAEQIKKALKEQMYKEEPDTSGKSRYQSSLEFKAQRDHRIGKLFGLLGEDKSIKKPENYDAYIKSVKDTPSESYFTNPVVSGGISAGTAAAYQLGIRGLAKSRLPWIAAKAGRAVLKAPHPYAKVAGATLLGIGGFFTYDAFRNAIDKSVYGKTHEEFQLTKPTTWDKEALTLGASILTGSKIKKASLRVLEKATEKNLVHEFALTQLKKFPDAKNAIKAGVAERKAAQLNIKASKLQDSIVTKPGIYDAVKAQETRVKETWERFLKPASEPVLKGKDGDWIDKMREAVAVSPKPKVEKKFINIQQNTSKLNTGLKPFNLNNKIKESNLKRPNDLFISTFGFSKLEKNTSGKLYITDSGVIQATERTATPKDMKSFVKTAVMKETPVVLKQSIKPKKVFSDLSDENLKVVLKKADTLGIDTALMEHVYGKRVSGLIKKQERKLKLPKIPTQSTGVETFSIVRSPVYKQSIKPGKVPPRPGLDIIEKDINVFPRSITKTTGSEVSDASWLTLENRMNDLGLVNETVDFIDSVITEGGTEFDTILKDAVAKDKGDSLISTILTKAELEPAKVAKEIIKSGYGELKAVKTKIKKVDPDVIYVRNALKKALEKPKAKKLSKKDMAALESQKAVDSFLKESEQVEYIDQGLKFDSKTKELDFSNWNKYITATAILVPISMLFPDDSEAGIIQGMIPKIFKKPVQKVATEATEQATKILSEMYEKSYVKIPVNGSKALPKMMLSKKDSANFAIEATKKYGSLVQTIKRTKGFVGIADRFMTTTGAGSLFFKAGGNPGVELGLRKIATDANIDTAMEVTGNILADVPGLNKEAANVISRVMKPLAKKFERDVVPLNAAEFKIKKLEGQAQRIEKTLKRKGLKKTKVEPLKNALAKAKGKLSELYKTRDKLKPGFKQFETEWDSKARILAEEFPETRIALAAEDTADFKHYPWLQNLLNAEEKEAVVHTKALMLSYKERSKQAGLEVIEDRPYMHHAFHPSWDEKAAAKRLKELDLDISLGTPLTKFFKRSKYSKMLMPDISYTMQRYIPDAEKRIQWSSFWGKGKKDSWYALSNHPLVKSNPALNSFFDRIKYMAVPETRTAFNDWANRYSAIEVFRLLGGSVSVPFKHAFKVTGTWSNLGVGRAFNHLPETLKISASNAVNSKVLAHNIEKMGVTGIKDINTIKKQAAKTYSHTNRMLSNLVDIDLPGRASSNFDTFLAEMNKKGSTLVRGIEAFDRTHTFLTTLDMAAKKGMTTKDAMYGVMDTIIRNNFLSGPLNPVWMKNPKVRALFLFQNTPYKLLERRVLGGAATARVGKKIINFAKEDRKAFKKELFELKDFIFKGQDEFKHGIISDAFKNEVDFMGTNLVSSFMKEILILGLMFTAGKNMLGWDLSPQLWHTPFLRHDTVQPTLTVSPIIQGALKTKEEIFRSHYENEETEFFISTFMKNWLGRGNGLPVTVNKLLRLSDNDIPERYKNSKFQYLFAIPSSD
jgi:hypothetical protein